MEDFIRTYTIEEKICDGLLDFFEQHYHMAKPGETVGGVDKNVKDSIDLSVSINDYDKRISDYRIQLHDCIRMYKSDFLEQGFPIQTLPNMNFNIQRYPPMGGFRGWHSERASLDSVTRCLVFMTYLNTVEVGGETEFFYQKVKIKPVKGLTVIWPSDFTHTHRGVPALHETKTISTGWINLHIFG